MRIAYFFVELFIILCFEFFTISSACPSECNQDSCRYGLLLCSDSNLPNIPKFPPKETRKVIITNQRFFNSVLSYQNLSKYGPENIILKELTIQNCGITDIESESFSHLIHLTHLDLSQNKIQTIQARTFKALNLKVLKLTENKLLTISKYSLQGLVVNHLSLANCGLKQLEFDSIKEISGHLTKLDLSNNKLEQISDKFFLLFRRLEELNLDSNHLKCNCKLKWLIRIFHESKLRKDKFSGITCFTPKTLSGKSLTELTERDFKCPLPTLEKLTVEIKSKTQAVLSCISTETTDNIVTWLVRQSLNNSTTDLIKSEKQSTLTINRRNSVEKDNFVCRINNENGNISIDVSLTWPKYAGIHHNIPPDSTVASLDLNQHLNKFQNEISVGDHNSGYLFVKQFTLFELLLSIASTFVITIVLFSTLYLILTRNCPNKNQHFSHVGQFTGSIINNNDNNNNNNFAKTLTKTILKSNHTNPTLNGISPSDIYSTDSQQIYDIPQLNHLSYSPNHHNLHNNNNTLLSTQHNSNFPHNIFQSSSPNLALTADAHSHLIDFKTQRLINPS